jgi:hypothetical protein
MVSRLRLQHYVSSCNGGFQDSCYKTCHQELRFEKTGGEHCMFGPMNSQVQTDAGEECDCTQFLIHDATIHSSNGDPQAVGSSPNAIPFSSVHVRRAPEDEISFTWRGSETLPFSRMDSCTAYYINTGGPAVLGTSGYYFASWWAVLVGCIFFLVLLAAIGSYCRYFSRGRPRYRGTTVSKVGEHPAISRSPADPNPPIQQAVVISPFRSSADPTGRQQLDDIPVATAVRVNENYDEGRQHEQVAIV